MLKTFNCGVGFCLITNKKNVKKIKKYFLKNTSPMKLVSYLKENQKLRHWKIAMVNKIKAVHFYFWHRFKS